LGRLLAEDVSGYQQQADGEVHEDQPRTFLVNAPKKEVARSLNANAEIGSADLDIRTL